MEKERCAFPGLKGLETSSQPLIVFVDDDNLVANNYISRAFYLMKAHKEVGLAGGLGFPVSTVPLPEWFGKYQGAYAVGPQAENEGVISMERTYLHGAGLVMRKDVWQHIMNNSFNFVLSGRKGKLMSSGEDSEISSAYRMTGYDLWYDPKLQFQHIIPENRLNWNYLVRLAREFGKSFTILDIYYSEIQEFTGWKRAKSHNWLLGTIICVYQLLRLFPSYIHVRFKKLEGTRKDFQFNFQFGVLIQRFKLIGDFNSRKKEILGFKERIQQSIK